MERIEGNFAHLSIEVDEAHVNRALDESYRRLVQRVTVPGFRKGKVPRPILEMRLGKGALYEDALKSLVPRVYMEAVKETGIDPVDEPDFDIEQIEEGKPLRFKAKVLVRPEVKLPDLRAIRVEKASAEVSDDEVNRYVEVLRRNRATAEPADHDAVQAGDLVTIDLELTSDGRRLDVRGGGKDLVVEAAAKQDLPGLGEGLTGLKPGEEKTIETTVPPTYPEKELVGKPALARVTVKGIRVRKLPEVNDEFAKAVGGFDSVEAMKRDIRERLEKSAQSRAEAEYRKAVVDRITQEAEVDVPERLVDRQVDFMVRDLAESLAQQGMTLRGYLEACGMDEETLRKSYRDDAKALVKSELVLDAISKAEGFVATPDEVDSRIAQIALRQGSKADEVRELLTKTGRIHSVEEAIVRDKTIDYLVGLARGE
ncbi:MAG: trigger factor [Firmicutes bacterium]|nr:trigger factor [Bacillota bacterium]MDH7496810.1 trigger factor [Bacillota bacterium]